MGSPPPAPPPPPTHTPCTHTGFLMSAHLSRLRLFQRHLRSLFRVWVWVWDLVHTSPHTLLHAIPIFLPPSFLTIFLSPAFTSLGWSNLTAPVLHYPPSPPRAQRCNRYCSNKQQDTDCLRLGFPSHGQSHAGEHVGVKLENVTMKESAAKRRGAA